MKITDIRAIEILDSRGNPTIKTYITLENGTSHSASVPSGASTGSHEAVELRDNDSNRYGGKGILKAVENVNTVIKNTLINFEADPNTVDNKLLELDGTPNKEKLGANALLSVSLAVCRAAAHAQNLPLWKFLNQYFFQSQTTNHQSPSFPRLMINIVNGGKHANWNFDIQEFMIVPNETKPSEAVRIASEIFHSLEKVLSERKLSTLVGDEGGYSPTLNSNEEVLDTIIEAAKLAGYENVRDYRLSLDCAATEWLKDGKYEMKKTGQWLNPEELTEYYSKIGQQYKILSFEDAFAEDDWESWAKFTNVWVPRSGGPPASARNEASTSDGGAERQDPNEQRQDLFIIGDDLFATNPERIKKGIDEKAANAVLIKENQIGTIKETAEAINMAHNAGWKTAISHRSGETEDSFIADLAYACGSEFIKTGSMSRSERLSKYNRLMEIEQNI